ncbi:hypothetical protein ABW21_db0205933 [Orbilia brochopaga]|nr:hypothetical protein ABW21_db0205933 [Drechslerella brochopaga]
MRSAQSHNFSTKSTSERVFETTGPSAVTEAEFLDGKISRHGVLLDTNFLRPVLESKNLSRWLSKVTTHGHITATTRSNIMEHMESKFLLLKKGLRLEDIEEQLLERGVSTINGPGSSKTAGSLYVQVLQMAYNQRYMAATKKLSEDEKPKAIVALNKKWNDLLKESGKDAAFACEAAARGLAFVTFDQKVYSHFGNILQKKGILTYAVRRTWLESSS